jgi:hypothetical protein
LKGRQRGRSREFSVLAQQGDQVGEALSGGGVGVELEFELGQSAAILASSSASRAFSLLSCSVSLSICTDSLLSCAVSLLSCAISFSISLVRVLDSSILLSMSGLRRQLSVDKNERHRGKDEPDTPLLRERDGAGGEGDVVIGGEQSDQGDNNAADGLDPALAIQNADGVAAAAL